MMKTTNLLCGKISTYHKALRIGLIAIAFILSGLGEINSAHAATLSGQDETSNPDAHDAYLRGWERYRLGTPDDLTKAVAFLEQAIKFDPDYARAYSTLAAVYWNIVWNNWWHKSLGLFAGQATELSRLNLKKAMEHPSPLAHQIASEMAAHFHRTPRKALAEAELAIAMDADDPAGHLAMSIALLKAGKSAEAVESVRTAMRLDPHYPASYITRLGQAQLANGQYEIAAETLVKAANRNPNDDWTFVYLAAAYGHLGYEQEAKQALDKANELRAKTGWGALTTQSIGKRYDFAIATPNYFKWDSDYKLLREGLRKAGVKPETNWKDLMSTGTSSIEVQGVTTIDAKTAKALHERGVPFVDAMFHWVQGRIPGAWFLEVWSGEFNEARLAEIAEPNQEVVIYSGRHEDTRYAPAADAKAFTWGFEKVYFFRDGLDGWKAAGYPVETGK